MADSLFDLYFSGKTLAGNTDEEVRLKVGKIFGADNETLNRLFSGNPVRIKAGVNQETAIKYRVALRAAGAMLEITPHKKSSVETNPRSDVRGAETFTLLPPNTGDLTDCAIPGDPLPLPDITDIVLAPTGVIIDESKQPPRRMINTDGMTLTAPNTGTLEDCRPAVKARPIPDISHIDLVRDDPTNAFTEKGASEDL